MQNILLENVRCFGGEQSAPLAPVTLLVGENSSGKSTFLAATRLAWDLANKAKEPDSNEDPFLLGSFNEIATFRSSLERPEKAFSIGARIPVTPEIPSAAPPAEEIRIIGRLRSWEGQPQLTHWLLECDPFRITIQFGSQESKPEVEIHTPSGTVTLPSQSPPSVFLALRHLVWNPGWG